MASLSRFPSLAATLFALAVCGQPVFAQRGLEYEVKAAFIFNFIQFVEWPPSALTDPAAPFRICVYGDDPFGPALERTIRGEQVKSHPLTIERVAVGGMVTQCQLLFVPQSQAGRTAGVLRAAGETPVLSVGESLNFLRAGGMINLFVEGGRVRFDVNLPAATARGFVVSSKLLRVARNTSEVEER